MLEVTACSRARQSVSYRAAHCNASPTSMAAMGGSTGSECSPRQDRVANTLCCYIGNVDYFVWPMADVVAKGGI
eukprot:893858-Prymnesium_polylepis.1